MYTLSINFINLIITLTLTVLNSRTLSIVINNLVIFLIYLLYTHLVLTNNMHSLIYYCIPYGPVNLLLYTLYYIPCIVYLVLYTLYYILLSLLLHAIYTP